MNPNFVKPDAVRPVPKGFAVMMAGQKMDKPDEMGIPIPEGFDLGGKGPGDMVQAVVEFTIGPDGKSLMPKTLNGIPLDGSKDTSAEDQDDEAAPFGSAMGGGDDSYDDSKGGA